MAPWRQVSSGAAPDAGPSGRDHSRAAKRRRGGASLRGDCAALAPRDPGRRRSLQVRHHPVLQKTSQNPQGLHRGGHQEEVGMSGLALSGRGFLTRGWGCLSPLAPPNPRMFQLSPLRGRTTHQHSLWNLEQRRQPLPHPQSAPKSCGQLWGRPGCEAGWTDKVSRAMLESRVGQARDGSVEMGAGGNRRVRGQGEDKGAAWIVQVNGAGDAECAGPGAGLGS